MHSKSKAEVGRLEMEEKTNEIYKSAPTTLLLKTESWLHVTFILSSRKISISVKDRRFPLFSCKIDDSQHSCAFVLFRLYPTLSSDLLSVSSHFMLSVSFPASV